MTSGEGWVFLILLDFCCQQLSVTAAPAEEVKKVKVIHLFYKKSLIK